MTAPSPRKTSVLFVCTGNICRSPTAEAIFRRFVADRGIDDRFRIESAGTHGYHVGHGADMRSALAARGRGYDLSTHRAKKLRTEDFTDFDFIVVMDDENMRAIAAICPAEHRAKVTYFLEHAPALGVREVPDPYYGGDAGFEHVLDLCEAAALALLDDIVDD